MLRPNDRQKFSHDGGRPSFFVIGTPSSLPNNGRGKYSSILSNFIQKFPRPKIGQRSILHLGILYFLCFWLANSLTTIRVPARRGNSRSIGFARRNMYQIKASPIEYSNMLKRSEVSSLKRRFWLLAIRLSITSSDDLWAWWDLTKLST